MEDITPPDQNNSRIEELQKKLYSPNVHFEIKPRKKLRSRDFNTQNDWNDGSLEEKLQAYEEPKRKFNFFMLFFVMALIFFLGALGFAAFNFYGGTKSVSGNDVDISVIGPVAIGGGDELTLDVIIQNNNPSQLETVDLVVEYPDGTKSSEDLRTDLPRVREGLGIIEPNSVVKRSVSAALFGGEGEEKKISVSVEYRLPGGNAIFEKKKEFNVVLQSSPIRLTVDSVKEITSNQELEFNVKLNSNSTETLNNIMVNVDYPFGFTLVDADFETFDKDNTWLFKELRPQEEIVLKIKGRLEGQNQEERVFNFKAGIQDEEIKNELGIVFTTLPKAVTISRPFLELKLAVDGDTSANLVRAGEQQIQGSINYLNNTATNIRDARIVVKLTGDVLNESSMFVSEGFYRSQDNTIIWDRTTTNKLEEIESGNSGTLAFSFRTKDLATLDTVFKNPEITMDALITGRRVSESPVPEEIESTTFKRIQFVSDVDLYAETLYGQGPFTNTGPIPPKVNSETTYTIKLEVENSSNLVEKGRIFTSLPNYVKWNNKFSGDGTVTYDSVSRTIEWNIGDINPHVGFTTPRKTAYIQVTLTPSVTQVSQSPALTSQIRFTGYDTFTNSNIEKFLEAITINVDGLDYNDNRVVN